ncbi:MAG: D-alanyl-D-alanine carboxypeptidase family protein [Bacillota bacterium]|nr:D-alanyl-D-alanine carboxypeptidase family protein [Bacillota bacterium]
MKKIYFCIILIVVSLLSTSTAFASPLDIPSNSSYILIDARTGQVIKEYNSDRKLRPASTTKIMTAILALEKGNLNDAMNVSKEAVYDIGQDGMNVGIMPGESNLTLENLLNVMLIKSANEAANIIAENIGGSKSAFVQMMNEKAKELGALNTNFVNPCGKDDAKEDANHLTTARDLAAIARYAMNIPKFREIVSKEYYKDMPVTNDHTNWGVLRTSDQLLWDSNTYPYTLDGVTHNFTVEGIKTGYTSVAGNNLVSSAVNQDGMELIAVIMHVTQQNKIFGYAKELLKYGFENYGMQKIADADKVVKTVNISDAKGNGSLDLVTASNLMSAMPLDKGTWNLESKENINLSVKAPVKQGDVLGYVEYSRNGISLGKVNVIASRNVEAIQPKVIVKKAGSLLDSALMRTIIILFITCLGFALVSLAYRKAIKKKNRKNYRI